LQEVAARRRLVAQLTRCARQQGHGQQRIALAHAAIGRQIAVGHLRTDAQAPVLFLDPIEGQPGDVD
jgi:hypothetical protein